MDSKIAVKNANNRIKKLMQKNTDKELLETTQAVEKVVFDIYANWDGDPKTLDTDTFTVEEALMALEDLGWHEEDEMGTGFQFHNATSEIITSREILCYLIDDIKQVKKRVVYV